MPLTSLCTPQILKMSPFKDKNRLVHVNLPLQLFLFGLTCLRLDPEMALRGVAKNGALTEAGGVLICTLPMVYSLNYDSLNVGG